MMCISHDIDEQDLRCFFPRMRIEGNGNQRRGIEDGALYELLIGKEKSLPFLQTLFFEERLIETQVDQGTRQFFATLWDHPPEFKDQEENSQTVFGEPEYQEGMYLQELDHLLLSPLEPVAGNIKVRSSRTVLFCFYTGTNAVELGTRFLRADTLRGASVLLFEYPQVGRIIRGNRPFRAKVPESVEMVGYLYFRGQEKMAMECGIMDISSHGLALENDNLIDQFAIGDKVTLNISSSFDTSLTVNAHIRHFAKIRTKKGNTDICGLQFDLETRALAVLIEQLYARVQRVFIRSLNERTAGQDIHLTLQ